MRREGVRVEKESATRERESREGVQVKKRE